MAHSAGRRVVGLVINIQSMGIIGKVDQTRSLMLSSLHLPKAPHLATPGSLFFNKLTRLNRGGGNAHESFKR